MQTQSYFIYSMNNTEIIASIKNHAQTVFENLTTDELVNKALERKDRPLVVALISVIKNNIQNHFYSISMKLAYHGFEFLYRAGGLFTPCIPHHRTKIVYRRVSPIVKQWLLSLRIFFIISALIKFLYWHELYSVNAKI